MGLGITGEPAADEVLDESAFALLVGMMPDLAPGTSYGWSERMLRPYDVPQG